MKGECKEKNMYQSGKMRGLARRRLLASLGIGAFSTASLCSAAVSDANSDEQIQQPDEPGDDAFIRRAFEMQRLGVEYGDRPYGAVVVRNGIIIGQSWSRVILDEDPTGHAEIAAIRDASRRTGNRDLSGTILYSSARPCPMCEAASYWARIDEMIYGNDAQRAGPPHLCR